MSDRIDGSYDAIILQERPFNEADVMLTALTADIGHQTFIARGLKKGTSRLRGIVAPFAECRLQLVQGKGVAVLTGADLVDAHQAIRNDYRTSLAAMYICDLFHQMTQENERDLERYSLLQKGLKVLPDLYPWQWLFWMEWQLLKNAGFSADLDVCGVCGKPLTPSHGGVHAGIDGTFSHTTCGPDAEGLQLMVAEYQYLRFLDTGDPAYLKAIQLRPTVRKRLFSYLGTRLSYVLDFPLRSRESIKGLI